MIKLNIPSCLPTSVFSRRINSFLKAYKITYPLSAETLATTICENGTCGREGTLGLIEMFGIDLVEMEKSTSAHFNRWYAKICVNGEAEILYPCGQLHLNEDDFELDKLQLEHEFGHLCYWGMMNYFGRLWLRRKGEF